MNTSIYTLGVDPAKQKSAFCLLDANGHQVGSVVEFESSRQGYDQLMAMLTDKVPAEARLFVGIEASCALDDNLLAQFSSMRTQMAVTLIRVDSAQVKHFAGPRPLRGKTDHADARRIASFTRAYSDQLARFESDGQLLAMQRLSNERLSLADDLTVLKNRLRDRLVISFPEFENLLADPFRPLALALLNKMPTAAHAAKKRPSSIENLRGTARGHYLGRTLAQRLIQTGRTSIASATSDDDAAAVLRLVARLQLVQEQIIEVEHSLDQFAKTDHPLAQQIALMQTLPGIALVSGAALVLRSQGLKRFSRPKALAAQVGICPDRHQTGSSSNTAHLTYRGDRRLRAVLFMSAVTACRHDPAMAFHRWRAIRAGNIPKQAICNCMNRLVRMAWALANTNKPYDPQRAIRNAAKHHPDLWKTFLADPPKMSKKAKKLIQITLPKDLK